MEPNSLQSELLRIANYVDRWESPSRKKVSHQLNTVLLLIDSKEFASHTAGWFSSTPLEIETKARKKIISKAPAKYDELVKFIKSDQFTFQKLTEYDLYTVILFCSMMKQLTKAEFDSYLAKSGVQAGGDATADQKKAYTKLEALFKFLENKPPPNSTEISVVFGHLGGIIGDARSKKIEDLFQDRTIVNEEKKLRLGILAKKVVLLALKKANDEILEEIKNPAGKKDEFAEEAEGVTDGQASKAGGEEGKKSKEKTEEEKLAEKISKGSSDIEAILTKQKPYKKLTTFLDKLAEDMNAHLDSAYNYFEYINRKEWEEDDSLKLFTGMLLSRLSKKKIDFLNMFFPDLDARERYDSCVSIIQKGQNIIEAMKTEIFGDADVGRIRKFFTHQSPPMFLQRLDFFRKHHKKGQIPYPEVLLEKMDVSWNYYTRYLLAANILGLIPQNVGQFIYERLSERDSGLFDMEYGWATNLYQPAWDDTEDIILRANKDAAEKWAKSFLNKSEKPVDKPGVAVPPANDVSDIVPPASDGVARPPTVDPTPVSSPKPPPVVEDKKKENETDGEIKYDRDQPERFTPDNTKWSVVNSPDNQKCLGTTKQKIQATADLVLDKKLKKFYDIWDGLARDNSVKDVFKGGSFDELNKLIKSASEKISGTMPLSELTSNIPESLEPKIFKFNNQEAIPVGPPNIVRGCLLYSNKRMVPWDSLTNGNFNFTAYTLDGNSLKGVEFYAANGTIYTFLKDYDNPPDLKKKDPSKVKLTKLPVDGTKGSMEPIASEQPTASAQDNGGPSGAPQVLAPSRGQAVEGSDAAHTEHADNGPDVTGAADRDLAEIAKSDPGEAAFQKKMGLKFEEILSWKEDSQKADRDEIFLRLSNAIKVVLKERNDDEIKRHLISDVPGLEYILTQTGETKLMEDLQIGKSDEMSDFKGKTPNEVLEAIKYYEEYAKESNPVTKAIQHFDDMGFYSSPDLLNGRLKTTDDVRKHFEEAFKNNITRSVDILTPSYVRVLFNFDIGQKHSVAMVLPVGENPKSGGADGMSKYFETEEGKAPHGKPRYYTKKCATLIYDKRDPGTDDEPVKILKGIVGQRK